MHFIWNLFGKIDIRPYFDIGNANSIITLIVTIAIPIIFFFLNEYHQEIVLLKDKYKDIFNQQFIISSISYVVLIFILMGSHKEPEIISSQFHTICCMILIKFIYNWIICLKKSIKLIYDKENIILNNLHNYEKDVLDIYTHAVKNENLYRISNILEYVIIKNNNLRYKKYEIINMIKVNNNLYNFKIFIAYFYKHDLKKDLSFNNYMKTIINDVFCSLNEQEKEIIEKFIYSLYVKNDYKNFINKFSFIFYQMTNSRCQKSFLYDKILSIDIKNNIDSLISDSDGALVLYNFVYNTSYNKGLEENELQDRFIKLFELINKKISRINCDINKINVLINLEMISFLFLHLKEEEGKSSSSLYEMVFKTIYDNIFFNKMKKNKIMYKYRNFFMKKRKTYKKFYTMDEFVHYIQERYKISLNNSSINKFKSRPSILDKELDDAQSISSEDYFQHMIGVFYVFKFYYINKPVRSIKFPIYTTKLTLVAKIGYGKTDYIWNWFYNFCIERGIFEYWIRCRNSEVLIPGQYYKLLSVPVDANGHEKIIIEHNGFPLKIDKEDFYYHKIYQRR